MWGGHTVSLGQWQALLESSVIGISGRGGHGIRDLSGWNQYFGGLVLDQEGYWGYKTASVAQFDTNMRRIFDSDFGKSAEWSTPHWLFDQWAGGGEASWAKQSAYRAQMVGNSHYMWPATELYSQRLDSIASSACRHSILGIVCNMIAPTISKTYNGCTIPSLSVNMYDQPIPTWGSKQWYIHFRTMVGQLPACT